MIASLIEHQFDYFLRLEDGPVQTAMALSQVDGPPTASPMAPARTTATPTGSAGPAPNRAGGAAHDRPDVATHPTVPPEPDAHEHDAERTRAFESALGELVAVPCDHLDEDGLRGELATVERAMRRLSARQTRLVGAVTARRLHRSDARGGGHRERQRAIGEVRRELTEDHNLSPSEAKQATELGTRLPDTPEVAAAFDAGELRPQHVRLLTETLRKLGPADRDRLEPELIAAGRRQDAVTFGRTCRRALAELAHDTAVRDLHRQHLRRRAAVAQDPDGTTTLSGRWSGVDAELVHTVIDAFRAPDTPGGTRSPEQRTADAVIEAFRAALRSGEAPAQHGVRPHIMITIPCDAVRDEHGVAEGHWTGPLPFGEVRRLLDDASVSRILTDPEGLPLEVGRAVRTVPSGLYRFLLVRDGGCIAEGCDAPAAWCDVMHLHTAYRELGRLRPDNAALGCRRHHRLFDRHTWWADWHDGRPVLRPPQRTPADP